MTHPTRQSSRLSVPLGFAVGEENWTEDGQPKWTMTWVGGACCADSGCVS
jgi:hypothetical protein